MKKLLWCGVATVALILAGCATDYQSSSVTGGYSDKQIEGDIYRVSFNGNGFATGETVQTYWLYRCASLALEKGYQGFEILSNISLVMEISPEELFEPETDFKKAQMIFVPMESSPKPHIQGDIRLLKGAITEAHPKVYDAEKLKATLSEYVDGKKCSGNNVCEHAHKYVYPQGSM